MNNLFYLTASEKDTKADIHDTCDHIVTVMKRRRSNAELQAAAIEALQCLLNGWCHQLST